MHGLTGSSNETWTDKNGLYWPVDLLSKDISDARILTFGYDADIVNFWNPASQNRISNHAQNLLGDLSNLRLKTDSVWKIPQPLKALVVIIHLGKPENCIHRA